MTLLNTLNNVFRYDTLKHEQSEIIDEIVSGTDIIALMPTGGGKSLTFQLPVIHYKERAVIVSPLIALMEDQVMQLKMNKIKACCIHRYIDKNEKQHIMNHIHDYQFIYCSPEWLVNHYKDVEFNFRPDKLIIDEAHCISEWGFDFRPFYLMLGDVIEFYDGIQVICLTATADLRVLRDIEKVTNRSFKVMNYLKEKNNLFLSAVEVSHHEEKVTIIKNILKESMSTVIYFNSKKSCNEITEILQHDGYIGEKYHADMTYEERMDVQDRFMNDEIQFVCATSAFGMGVNKSNIRTVIHYHLPKSVFQFIQETGRAGRDGKLSQSIVLYSQEDFQRNINLIEMNRFEEELFDQYKAGLELNEEDSTLYQVLTSKFSEAHIKQRMKLNDDLRKQDTFKLYHYVNEKDCLYEHYQKLCKILDNSVAQEVNINPSLRSDQLLESIQSAHASENCSICKNTQYLKFGAFEHHSDFLSTTSLVNRLFNLI